MFLDSNPEAPFQTGEPGQILEAPQRNPHMNGDFLLEEDIPPTDQPEIYHAHGAVAVRGSKVRYTVAASENCQDGDGVIIFGNGFSGFKSSSSGIRDAGAAAGEYTVSLDTLRHDKNGPWNNLAKPHEGQVDALSVVVEHLKQNNEVKKNLPGGNDIDFDNITLELHSMAGITGTMFAAQNPAIVSRIRYLAAAGFGGPNIIQLARELPLNGFGAIINDVVPIIKNENFQPIRKTFARLVRHHRRIDRSVGEILSCLYEDMRKSASELEIPTSYLAFEDDVLVPPDHKIANHVDIYGVMPNIGHCAPQHSPAEVLKHVHELEEVAA